jgi:hypothetical protein
VLIGPSTSFRILFRTQDLSLVKEYLYRQWTKLIQGKVSVQDFTFAKEVRLGTYRSVDLGSRQLRSEHD